MRYNTPELVVLGAATSLVQGLPEGELDNGQAVPEHQIPGVAMGLDD